MSVVGQIELLAKIDSSDYKRGAKEIAASNKDIERSVNNADDGMNSMDRGVSRLASGALRVGAIAFAAMGAAATLAFKNIVEEGASLQSTRASMESLTGSVDKARGLISDLNKFSFSTAFSSSDINQSAKLLLGFGIASDKVLTNMRVLGDISGATGADLKSLALVFGQVNASGRLMGQDALQLINNNVPITTILAKKLGLSVAEVKEQMEKGAITADIFNEALSETNKQGGFAFEGAIKQSRTLTGRFSNMQESLIGVGLAIVGIDKATGDITEGGIFDNLSKAVEGLGTLISENQDNIIGFVNGTLKGLADGFKFITDSLKPLTDSFGPFMEAFQPVIDALGEGFEEISKNKEVVDGLRIVILGLGIALAIIVAAIALFVIGVAAVVAGIAYVVGFVADLFASIGYAAYEVGKSITDAFVKAYDWVIKTFNGLGKFFSNLLNDIVKLFSDVGSAIGNAVGGAFRAVMNSILSYVGGIVNGIIDSINGIVGAIDNVIPGDQSGYKMKRLSIPRLAEGGIVSSATLAMVGEGSESEAIIPLSKLDEMMNGGSSKTPSIVFNLQMDGVMTRSRSDMREISMDMIESINEVLRARQLPEIGNGHLKRGAV